MESVAISTPDALNSLSALLEGGQLNHAVIQKAFADSISGMDGSPNAARLDKLLAHYIKVYLKDHKLILDDLPNNAGFLKVCTYIPMIAQTMGSEKMESYPLYVNALLDLCAQHVNSISDLSKIEHAMFEELIRYAVRFKVDWSRIVMHYEAPAGNVEGNVLAYFLLSALSQKGDKGAGNILLGQFNAFNLVLRAHQDERIRLYKLAYKNQDPDVLKGKVENEALYRAENVKMRKALKPLVDLIDHVFPESFDINDTSNVEMRKFLIGLSGVYPAKLHRRLSDFQKPIGIERGGEARPTSAQVSDCITQYEKGEMSLRTLFSRFVKFGEGRHRYLYDAYKQDVKSRSSVKDIVTIVGLITEHGMDEQDLILLKWFWYKSEERSDEAIIDAVIKYNISEMKEMIFDSYPKLTFPRRKRLTVRLKYEFGGPDDAAMLINSLNKETDAGLVDILLMAIAKHATRSDIDLVENPIYKSLLLNDSDDEFVKTLNAYYEQIKENDNSN